MTAPARPESRSAALETLEAWFDRCGWKPSALQRDAWRAWLDGASGLVHAATGTGKTLAAVGGPVVSALLDPKHDGLALLWVTPLRALARDTAANLQRPFDELGIPWRVETRMGDTPSSRKSRQRKRMPQTLVTTPESLSVLLSYPEGRTLLSGLRGIVVDEWHELIGTKRGTQTELGLARLRRWNPGVPVWGLSATLGNPAEALDVLAGPDADRRLLRGPEGLPPEVVTLLPERLDRFPWSGHIGLGLLPQVLERLEPPGTALLFTNTRALAERWHEAIVSARPEWSDEVALHHGSLARPVRTRAEEGLADGSLRCVVATSTLDLGIDFGPVDRVFQVGSPKGVGRLLQRAGRSGHTPEGRSRVYCVPAQAIEVAEFAAARRAIERGAVEARRRLEAPLDVLAQHMVTIALGGGFEAPRLLAEVRTAHAYRDLSDAAWAWCLDFVTNGGPALKAYPRYARVRRDGDRFVASKDRSIQRTHRLSIGTITSAGHIDVRWLKGGRLGSVEESFLARLSPGDVFTFAGRRLKLVRVRDMVAWVRAARRSAGSVVPRWAGGRMPISSELGTAVMEVLERPDSCAEMRALAPLIELQRTWSHLPTSNELLLESTRTREGQHLFLHTFLGRRVHDGLAALIAHRLARHRPATIQLSATDHGIELLSAEALPVDELGWDTLLSDRRLTTDLMEAFNEAELGRRRFREVARVSGLVHEGFPGRSKSTRQLQASSGLIWDVLLRYDPDNRLVDQAQREVLERDVDVHRLRAGLRTLQERRRVEVVAPRLTPFAFPIWAERIQASVSSESWLDRVRRMAARLERHAADPSTEGEAA